MELIKIQEAAAQYGVSSRTLRYYEEAGILWSTHPDGKLQRYYEEAALERLAQIIILRKLQIPIKDIAFIYQNNRMESLIRAFANKLNALDEEITSLSELRQLVNTFLQKINRFGLEKLTSLSLLYEETKGSVTQMPQKIAVSLDDIMEIDAKASPLRDVRILRLPVLRVLTSVKANGQAEPLDTYSMQHMLPHMALQPSQVCGRPFC